MLGKRNGSGIHCAKCLMLGKRNGSGIHCAKCLMLGSRAEDLATWLGCPLQQFDI